MPLDNTSIAQWPTRELTGGALLAVMANAGLTPSREATKKKKKKKKRLLRVILIVLAALRLGVTPHSQAASRLQLDS